jgi:hypothetical protein
LAVLPVAFVFGFAEGAGISSELALLTSGFCTTAFFAGGGGSAGDVVPLRAVRALVVLVTAGTAGCALVRAEALVAVGGFPDMVRVSTNKR